MRTSFNSLLLGLALCASAAWGSIEILDRVAIIVEDDIVLQSEFEQRLQQVKFTLSQQGRPAPPPTELRKLVENQLIVESLQMQMANRAGVRISDAQLNEAVGRVAAQNGMTLEAFREEVGRQGMSYGETREQIRREMTIQQVQQGSIRSRVEISEREIDSFMQSSAGQNATSPRYHIAHIMLPVEEAAGAAEEARKRQLLDRAAADIRQGTALLVWLENYNRTAGTPLQGGDLGWRRSQDLPGLFADVVPPMAPGEVAGPLRSAGGLHLVQLVERRGGAQVIDQAHARHILIKTSEIRSDQQAQDLLKELRQRALAGEDFGDLARQYTDDIGSAQEGGDLGWSRPGQFVPAFEEAMAATPTSQISQPFQSQFGWHILQVMERRQYDISKDNAREQAYRALYQRKFQEELEDWLQKIRDEAYVDIKI